MDKETLKKIEDGIMKPINDFRDVGYKQELDFQDVISKLSDLGKVLKSIEDKLNLILAKLNS